MYEFYIEHNIGKTHFAELAKVGLKTLKKYEQGKPIRSDSRQRIEFAKRIFENNELVYPDVINPFGGCFTFMRYRKDVEEMDKKYHELVIKERA